MGFKSKQTYLTFSEIEKSFRDQKNKSLETLMNLDKTIIWDRIETILMRDYPVGHKKEGNKAYPPLFLFKCLLIQKWFRINSDPELENLINDRRSFRKFLGLSEIDASPDHSTFSKFRKRLTKGKFDLIVGDILTQFSEKGLEINEGIAVDAKYGFVLTTVLSKASVNDTNYLAYCTLYSRHIKYKLAIVYADKGYAGESNRSFLAMNNLKDGILRKDTKMAKLMEHEIERNKKISKVRYIVEQYFGLSHLHDNGQRAIFTTIDKNNMDIWFRQVAFNIKRGFAVFQRVATA